MDGVDEDDQDTEEEHSADSDWERQRKKKRKKKGSEKNCVFDEDDFELLEDNISGFQSPKLERTKFKRLKKAMADADEGQSGFSDEEDYIRRLFGGDDDPPFEDIAEEDGDIGEEEDDMAGIIVDEHGVSRRTRKVNKKKSKQVSGASSSAIQEAHGIFGDELFSRYDDTDEGKQRRLEDEFESTILSNNKTEKDMYIRVIDIPERMQISEESTGPPPTDGMSIEEESTWILHQFGTTKEGHDLAILKDDIMRFLELTHVHKLDVPFIAMYRKDECQSLFKDPESQGDKDSQNDSDQKPTLRWHKVLWAILELDKRWLLLQKRKIALMSYYTKRFEEEKDSLTHKLFDSITMSLKAANSEKEIDDVDLKFNLHFPPGDEEQFKKPKRKSQYSICRKAGLRELANNFSCSSEEFGLLITLKLMGFEEWRRAFVEPSKDEELFMMCGETEDSLSRGKIVQATVRRVRPRSAICFLKSGLTGILRKKDYSDEKLKKGDIITAKIKSFHNYRCQVTLSCRESDLRSDNFQNNKNMDPYYHENHDNSKSGKEKDHKANKHFKSRMIVHPHFRNITTEEAMEMLSDKQPGESIIHPSSRGPSYLTLTLKIYEGVYAHKDIIEGGKDTTSMLRLGKALKVGDDLFEDLDEVMNRYVDPFVNHLKKMLGYRKFKGGEKMEVDESLKKEKIKNPFGIVYVFSICHEYPGLFILTYIRSSNLHHEYVGLCSKGFKFREKVFDEIDKLVAHFKGDLLE